MIDNKLLRGFFVFLKKINPGSLDQGKQGDEALLYDIEITTEVEWQGDAALQ